MHQFRRFWVRWSARARAGWLRRRGQLRVLPTVYSPQLDNRRDLLVFVPPSYARGHARYPVIYMQDGQNLFHAETSFAGTWSVGEAIEWASRRGVEAIVVGIPNAAKRIAEYSPFVGAEGGGAGDRYLEFITRTVKPLVDERFRTVPDRPHTGIAGSSMGGLISLYAFFRYSEVFGFAAALSPSVWFAGGAILEVVARAPRTPGRLYLDIGMREGERSVEFARRLRDLLVERGFQLGRDLQWVEDRDGVHHESAWGPRFRTALPFLLREDATR
ncbi:MAG TPA: alpha/beta hydrolase-fold protein [Gemmatimonadales bacterium]|nr:alpha/beta hydrolase-fold protein [Gemmatimonadales bacterium]